MKLHKHKIYNIFFLGYMLLLAAILLASTKLMDNSDVSTAINDIGLLGNSGVMQIIFAFLILTLGLFVVVMLGNVLATIILPTYTLSRDGCVLLINAGKMSKKSVRIPFTNLDDLEMEKGDAFMTLCITSKDGSKMSFVISAPFYLTYFLSRRKALDVERRLHLMFGKLLSIKQREQ
ncbi:hypothetical protein [Sphingobacterium bambusae]|uniref:Uncharacterized protein n=1 Tax=Sphingobacterium bambusae TaxID=662858 RepID=A0ABW6BCF9_9SPHI|nr:hypothetical protein [Sphingobacterium bambusae]WPL49594.1 hypothetical protein SCB77_03900 [Sphingobacterium bambusae]